jgi:hypothetical protein
MTPKTDKKSAQPCIGEAALSHPPQGDRARGRDRVEARVGHSREGILVAEQG